MPATPIDTVAYAITDRERQEEASRSLPTSKQGVLERVVQYAAQVSEAVDLELEPALRLAGCATVRTERQPPQKAPENSEGRLDPRVLQACHDFLAWLYGVLQDLDTLVDRRLATSGTGRLLDDTGTQVPTFLAVIHKGTWSADHLLRLGEFGIAWRTARSFIPGPVGDRARRLLLSSPYAANAPHLSPSRVALLETRCEHLGPRVKARMQQHLHACDVCRSAYPDAP